MSCFFGCPKKDTEYTYFTGENGLNYRKCKCCGKVYFEKKVSVWLPAPKEVKAKK